MTMLLDRVLVTGAAGFVGSWLCRRLIDDGKAVAGLVRNHPAEQSLFARLGLMDQVDVWPASDTQHFSKRLESFKPTTVINLAGQSQIGAARENPAEAFRTNTAFAWELLDVLRQMEQPPALVHASTEAVYGSKGESRFREPDCAATLAPYAASKAAAEIVVRCYGATYDMPVVIVRFGNIYGPGDPNEARLIPDLTRSFAAEQPPRLREAHSVRTYLHVDDAVDALLHLAAHARDESIRGEVFNVAGERPYTNLEVARLAREASGRADIRIVVGDAPSRTVQHASTEKIRRMLDWHPRIDLADGLRQIASQEAKW